MAVPLASSRVVLVFPMSTPLLHPSNRRWELDALRGLMLVLMTLTHMPTMFSLPSGQPFGFVSAAEGFVFLSAYMAGRVYGKRARRDGVAAMQSAFHERALKLYLCQLALLSLVLLLNSEQLLTTLRELT
mgnify:CR=1 FL=1